MTSAEIDAVEARMGDPEHASEDMPWVIAALREARSEAQYQCAVNCANSPVLWERACRDCPWLKNPFLVEQKVETSA